MIHDILLSLISADTDPLPILEFTVSYLSSFHAHLLINFSWQILFRHRYPSFQVTLFIRARQKYWKILWNLRVNTRKYENLSRNIMVRHRLAFPRTMNQRMEVSRNLSARDCICKRSAMAWMRLWKSIDSWWLIWRNVIYGHPQTPSCSFFIKLIGISHFCVFS